MRKQAWKKCVAYLLIATLLLAGCSFGNQEPPVAENARVVDSIVFPNCVIQENVIVNKSILLDNVRVEPNNVIGNGQDVVVIEDHKVLESSGLLQ